MRGDDQARNVGPQQWVAVAWWFDAEHVGGRATQMAATQGVGECLFVDHAATCGIDHKGPGFEQCQFAGADKITRMLGERAVKGQRVDLG